MTRVLVTGASGFVGTALLDKLVIAGTPVRAAFRVAPLNPPRDVEAVVVGELCSVTDWTAALVDVHTVVHLAGPAHAKLSEKKLHIAIVDGTAALAAQAERAGVQRFIFVSSIKAAAARTRGELATEADEPAPKDSYGRAKLEAERTLMRSALNSVVLRPPLVHASNAKANFAALMRLADTSLPLPLQGFLNRRSLISLNTLVEAIIAVLRKAEGPRGVFHVADRPSLSTGAIVAALRVGMKRRERLFRLPGAEHLVPRVLSESLEIDDASFRSAYGYGECSESRAVSALVSCGREWKNQR